ncbi:MAG: dihydroneopterin aldolase [Gammaproteobacteria bacterium]|nr:dihydroneopterin aldolase [Gammaproteobacteria bacterium]MBU1978755.1 dihydroneopterin aldolase [Gammaproteobacteria bacterium]
MDIVFLEEIKLDIVIGIYEWERKVPQTIRIDIDIGLPHSRGGETDNIEDTIDYGAVMARIRQTAAEQQFSLVEALAEHIATLIRTEFGAPWVKVSVAKLGMLRGVKRLGIMIERGERPSA